MSKVAYLTIEGLQKIKKELDNLMNIERPRISAQIADARDKGDLMENAEYEAAKEAQAMLELKISKLNDVVANFRIINEKEINTSTVQILNKVKIKNLKNNTIMEYLLVSETEADLKAGKLSINTPIAQGLIGKKAGDIVEVKVPSGIIEFEILNISV